MIQCKLLTQGGAAAWGAESVVCFVVNPSLILSALTMLSNATFIYLVMSLSPEGNHTPIKPSLPTFSSPVPQQPPIC